MASCSTSGSRGELMRRLEELQCGVVRTFRPTDAELVGHYLYGEMNRVHGGNGKQVFPELEVYGKTGMEPWSIWESLEPIRIPHQEYSYFFARLKSLSKDGIYGKGKRCSRTVGSGGTWSETEPFKEVNVEGFQEPVGRMRKFRYENKKSDHHGAWMMEEFSIDHRSDVVSSNLVLCRMKMNDKGCNKRKRKSNEDEEANARRTKSSQAKKQVISHSHHEQQQPQLSDFHPQELLSVRDLLFGDNVAHQAGLEQGSTSAQQQQIPTPNFDKNNNITADDVIVSQNENEHADWEDDTSWLDKALDEDVDPSFSDSQIEEEGTDHNGSTSKGTEVKSLLSALLEEHTSSVSSPLMSQQQEDLSFSDDDQPFAFACDNEFIPMDGASSFQFDDDNNNNFCFLFDNQYLSEEVTLPQFPVPH